MPELRIDVRIDATCCGDSWSALQHAMLLVRKMKMNTLSTTFLLPGVGMV